MSANDWVNEAVREALEATAPNSARESVGKRANASDRDIESHKRLILRFMEELDAELTVGEIRDALE